MSHQIIFFHSKSPQQGPSCTSVEIHLCAVMQRTSGLGHPWTLASCAHRLALYVSCTGMLTRTRLYDVLQSQMGDPDAAATCAYRPGWAQVLPLTHCKHDNCCTVCTCVQVLLYLPVYKFQPKLKASSRQVRYSNPGVWLILNTGCSSPVYSESGANTWPVDTCSF